MNYSKIIKITGIFLLGVGAGLGISRVFERVAGKAKVSMDGISNLRVDAAPSFTADITRTEHAAFWLSVVVADNSQLGIMFDQGKVLSVMRVFSDANNQYTILDKNGDGYPELRKTRNLKTNVSTLENLAVAQKP